MTLIRTLIASVLVFACITTNLHATQQVRIWDDTGGRISDYTAKYAQPDVSWKIDGECLSACTLVLHTGHVCATAHARLGFHAAKIIATGDIAPVQTERVYEMYPADIRKFIDDHHAMEHIWPMTFLTAPEIWKYVPKCSVSASAVAHANGDQNKKQQ